MKRFYLSLFVVGTLVCSSSVRANFLDQLGAAAKTVATNALATNLLSTNLSVSTLTTNLSQDQMVNGLKQALSNGVQHAVSTLGQTNGFLTNVNVRIPLPARLAQAEKLLRSMKQEKLADNFVATMNHAAEQAVPEAVNVFADSVKQMTISDAKTLLTGGTNSATLFLRRTTETNLLAKFLPIVQKATATNGVMSAYKSLAAKVPASSLGTTLQNVSQILNLDPVANKEAADLDAYVTQKALDGLFKMISDEEKAIRENPAARSTQLLQQVFGAVKPQ